MKQQQHNYERIKEIYLRVYQEAIKENKNKLYTDVENWTETLNEIELKFLSDIKWVGLLLYPYYPIANFFADFANPFKKIAVFIIYKNTDKSEIQNKVDYLSNEGWYVYTIESKSVTYTAEELYSKVGFDTTIDFYELDRKNLEEFINRYKDSNSQCLLYSIRDKHFKTDHQLIIEEEV